MPKAQPIRPSTTIVPTHQVIAHPPVFKIFDLAQKSGWFRVSNSETSLLLSTYKICPRRKIGSHQMQQQFELRTSHTLRTVIFPGR